MVGTIIATFLGSWALELGKQKVGDTLLKGLDQRLNSKDLERYLAKAIATANESVPLFSSYQADGLQGYLRFLSVFFKGRALAELQKPLGSAFS